MNDKEEILVNDINLNPTNEIGQNQNNNNYQPLIKKDAENAFFENNLLNNSNSDDDINNPLNIINLFNVILLGDVSVGKTSIFKRFITGDFTGNNECTLSVEYKSKYLKLDENLYAEVIIWDTLGAEKYKSITKQYFKAAQGILLIFDLTVISSFNNLNKWLDNISDEVKGNAEIILVGNKSDLPNRVVSREEAEKFAHEYGYEYYETSAKEGSNILLVFEVLTKNMNKKNEKEENDINELQSTYIARLMKLDKRNKEEEENQKCC